MKNYSPDSKELIVKGADLVYTRLYVVAAYVFSLTLQSDLMATVVLHGEFFTSRYVKKTTLCCASSEEK